LNSICIVKNMW